MSEMKIKVHFRNQLQLGAIRALAFAALHHCE